MENSKKELASAIFGASLGLLAVISAVLVILITVYPQFRAISSRKEDYLIAFVPNCAAGALSAFVAWICLDSMIGKSRPLCLIIWPFRLLIIAVVLGTFAFARLVML